MTKHGVDGSHKPASPASAPEASQIAAETADSARQASRLAAARALIERDYRRSDLTLSRIARAAHFSVYHFHRLFRRRYGQTPKQLITALRVTEVQRLARAGTSFQDAAKAVGFAHQSHMTTHFKRIVGLTPRTWLRTPTASDGPTDAATLRCKDAHLDGPGLIPAHVDEAGATNRRLRVHINLARLRENLSNADGVPWTEPEVVRWLHDAKFTRDGDAWIVREADLGQLEPEEVTRLQSVQPENP